ncbi:hypothetical protein AB833_18290 [Chromatiales bacterium (ex Bugula neritina AB1)]|nr:hypothetical protein AB833_18290 [Chromatiales bacterium (ex Bugula neritina AB1)]
MTSASERDRHLQRSAALVDEKLSGDHADIVVLPELSSIDYSRSAFSNLDVLAEPVDGSSFQVWKEVAERHQCWLVYGFAHRIDQSYSIASAAISPDGEFVGLYNKLHLAQFGDSMEKEYFSAGKSQLLVLNVGDFKLATIICYDIRIPELCRTLALQHNVDAILHMGAYARDPSFDSWHQFVTTRAIENQLYFLSLNRAGPHFGDSVFCKPWVDSENPPFKFDAHAEDLQFLTIDRRTIERVREEYRFLGDRLPTYELPVVP